MPTLDQVATAFEDWRSIRSKRGPIPKALIEQAIELADRYSKSDITRRLGINHSMLNRWMNEKRKKEGAFIALPVAATESQPEPEYTAHTQSLEVSIQFVSGVQLSLTGGGSDAARFISELQQRGLL